MKRSKKKKTNIVIGGYYGFGSIGDEAVLSSILKGIAESSPDCFVTVLTKNKRSLPKVKGITLTATSRTNPFSIILQLLRARVYISGGGSLLQDCTSRRSLSYYTSLLALAKLCRCKTFVYANGIGPVENTKKCRTALLLADIISLRDPDSYSFVKMLLPEKEEVYLSADPVFLTADNICPAPFLSCLYSIGNRPYFAVSVRRCCRGRNVDTEKLLCAIRYAQRLGFVPVFVSMQNSYDLEISRYLSKKTNGIIADVRDERDLCRILSGASFAIGMRLHFLLFAALQRVPAIPLSYDRKVESCLRYMGVTKIINAFDFAAADLITMIGKAIHDKVSTEKIALRCSQLSARAKADTLLLSSLLSDNKEALPQKAKHMEEVSG